MKIGLDLFVQAAQALKPSFVICDKDLASSVRRAELFTGDTRAISHDILYVMDRARAEALPDTLRANLLVVGAPADIEIAPLCNRVFISGPVDLPKLIQLLGACSSALMRFDAYCPELLSALVAGSSLDDLLDIVAAVMQNPVTIMRIPGVAVAHSKQVQTNDALWDRLVYEGSPIMEEVDLFDGYIPSDLFQGLEHPRYFVQSPWKRRIMMGIWISGNCSHVLTILENDRTFDKSDELLSEAMAQVLSSALQQAQDLMDSPGVLFGRLVSGELEPSERVMLELSKLGFPTTNAWKMVLFESDGNDDTYLNQIRFLSRLREATPDHLVFSHGNNSVAFVDADDAEKVDRLFAQTGENAAWSMGVSMAFSSLRDLDAAYRQCRKCLMACKSNQKQQASFEEIMLEDFYSDAVENKAWEGHVLPVAEHIVDYDARNETEFARTLWAYLKNFCDKNKTAAELFIHRNSITYRLEKIRDLFGVSLEDMHALRTLETSFELLHALGRL